MDIKIEFKYINTKPKFFIHIENMGMADPRLGYPKSTTGAINMSTWSPVFWEPNTTFSARRRGERRFISKGSVDSLHRISNNLLIKQTNIYFSFLIFYLFDKLIHWCAKKKAPVQKKTTPVAKKCHPSKKSNSHKKNYMIFI